MGTSENDAERQPSIDFSTFAISLASAVSMHLDPTGPDHDVVLAKQTIDILEMLSVKTEGNLDDEESALLSGLLYETRMAYVKATSA